MKKTLFIAAGIVMLTVASCKNKDAEESIANDTIAADSTAAAAPDGTATTVDTVARAERGERVPEDKNVIQAAAGQVTAVINGKDGYTATVLNAKDSIVYDVVISRTSLKERYQPVKVGDKILAVGGQYKVGERQTIKATSLKVKAS